MFWIKTEIFIYIMLHRAVTLWIRNPLKRGVLVAPLCDQVCQWLESEWWFSPDTRVSSTNKTDHHDITEILLNVALSNINQQTRSIFPEIELRVRNENSSRYCRKRCTLVLRGKSDALHVLTPPSCNREKRQAAESPIEYGF